MLHSIQEISWKSNLDNWKSRRRKLSESAFKRQEEMRQLEQDEQVKVTNQKKTKTFSEIMEERAHRTRAASLCLYMNQPDPEIWGLLTGEKEDDSFDNNADNLPTPFNTSLNRNETSEEHLDDQVCNITSPIPDGPTSTSSSNGIQKTRKIGRSAQQNLTSLHNGNPVDVQNEQQVALPQSAEEKPSEPVNGVCTDSGLDSLSSSHRTGDVADSSLDFSQESSSSLEVEMPDLVGVVTTGTQLLEEFSCENCKFDNKHLHKKYGTELSLKIPLKLEHDHNYGFTLKCDRDKDRILVETVRPGSICDKYGLKEGDCIIAVNGKDVNGMSHGDVDATMRNSSSEVMDLSVQRASCFCSGKCHHTTCDQFAIKQRKTAEVPNKSANSVVKMTILSPKNSNKGDCLKEVANTRESDKTSVKPPSVLPKPKLQTKVCKQTKQELDSAIDSKRNFSGDSKFSQNNKNIKVCNEHFINNCEMSSSFSAEIAKKHEGSGKVEGLCKEGKNKCGSLKPSELTKGKQKKALVHSPTSPSEDSSESQNCFDNWNSSLNAIHTAEKLKNAGESSDIDSQHFSHTKYVSTEPVSAENGTCDFSSNEGTDIADKCHSPVHCEEKQIKDTVAEENLTLVEKVTEEMERLILEQLEKEEQARENSQKSAAELPLRDISSDLSLNEGMVLRDSPSLHMEPPKEKPPPPPVDSDSLNDNVKPLVRVNSTKRIKKELLKRRSDFLGIEHSGEVEVYLEKQNAAPSFIHESVFKVSNDFDKKNIHWLKQKFISEEEEELAQKEREIIEDLEWEENKRKEQEIDKGIPEEVIIIDNSEEKERILRLQVERKRMGEERLQREEQRIRMEEERQLRDREECIRKQEETLRMEREKLRFEQEALQREKEQHWLKMQNQQGCITENIPKVDHDKPHTPVVLTSMSLSPEEEDNVLHSSHSSQSASDVSFSRPQRSKDDADQNASWSQVQEIVKENSIPLSVMKNSLSNSKITHNNFCAKHSDKISQKKQSDLYSESRYNQNHWLIQEAEIRRIVEQKERQRLVQPHLRANFPLNHNVIQRPCGPPPPPPPRKSLSYTSLSYGYSPDQWNYNYRVGLGRKHVIPNIVSGIMGVNHHLTNYSDFRHDNLSSQSVEPSRIVPIEHQEQMLSVSGRKRCSHCGEELGRGAAMIIESLQLVYHIQCFRCCVCQAQLGNGSCGTDVRVRNNKLHCQNCYSNDEAGLKFSQV